MLTLATHALLVLGYAGPASAFVPAPIAPARMPVRPAPARSAVLLSSQSREGILSPAVRAAKAVLGDERLNKLRGAVIAKHTQFIQNFVSAPPTPASEALARKLFQLADKNRDGQLQRDEVRAALLALGFTHLDDDKVDAIMARADADANGSLDFDEFLAEAPKTLKPNLVKLAKRNGNDLGLLV